MEERNKTQVMEFILLGLTEDPNLQVPLFVFFLQIYIVTVLGNVTMIILIKVSPELHTPMYFLLSCLSFVDLCSSSDITPKMLVNFLSKNKTISLVECAVQLFCFAFMGSTEVFLLMVMSYDRYVAICNPLLYNIIMTEQVCTCIVAGVGLVAFTNALINTICTFRLSFCGSNTVTHFYCDVPPLLKLSCSDTSLSVALLFFLGGGIIFISVVLILISYANIIYTIMKIKSSDKRWRAFSTCSSHLICVSVFFGTLAFMYVRPSSAYSLEYDRIASVFYTIINPMLNPLIYSLRNKAVKNSMRKVMS
ncbi:olfactory receptor 5AP2-like [Pleurodeles waltl]|uniref:olfactory receptor 5AP2-like n=1 Tax=Pleurodeles waltl TaxID=8319 RepID=UPI0037096E42